MSATKINYDEKSQTVTLTFKYDPKGDYSPSKTGKTLMVATTNGNVTVMGTELKVGLNAFVPNPDYSPGKAAK